MKTQTFFAGTIVAGILYGALIASAPAALKGDKHVEGLKVRYFEKSECNIAIAGLSAKCVYKNPFGYRPYWKPVYIN
jgi:hypothetical protein